jgi:hypothetical protein
MTPKTPEPASGAPTKKPANAKPAADPPGFAHGVPINPLD